MVSLHKLLVCCVRSGGWDGLEEDPEYPEGITSGELSGLLKDKCSTMVFLPADLVPDSETAKRIKKSEVDLGERYVLYREFRYGIGHDQPG